MKKQFFTLVFLLASYMSFSQLKLEGIHCTIGSMTPHSSYHLNVLGSMNLSGAFPGVSNPSYMRFNVFNARISGYVHGFGHQVSFYDSEANTFNNVYAANFYQSSDSKLKTNIASINYGLGTINKLRPVSYYLIKDPSGKNEHKSLGFIAQEIEQVLPELVATDQNGNKLVNYTGVIPVLVKAIQELQKEVAELKAAK